MIAISNSLRPGAAIPAFLDVRFAGFIAAIFLYALLGSPTPDHPGWIELCIALLLAAALFEPALGEVLRFRSSHMFLLYGLVVPLVTGVLNGHGPGAMARDVTAFLFLTLPLFAAPLLRSDPVRLKIFIGAFLVLGLAFSLRSILDVLAVFPRT